MCAKQQILLLSLLCIALVAANSNASSNNMLQSKIIHIVDMQGMLDSIDFNASSKHIETISIANNYNETLLELQTAATNKLLAQLAAQLAQLALRLDNLNATLLSKNVAATSCSALESVQLLVLPKIYPFRVLCAACKAGSGWIVLQQRFDGSLSYYRDWLAYRNGFGYYNSEFFLGLEYVYQLTNSRPYELYIELIDFDNRLYSARYGNFLVGSEQEQYALKSLGTYSGSAGDALSHNLHNKFSTYDRDNDAWTRGNCADYYESGWWFSYDTNSNLNGRYLKRGSKTRKGIWWYTLHGYQSLQSVRMLIKPKYTLV